MAWRGSDVAEQSRGLSGFRVGELSRFGLVSAVVIHLEEEDDVA